MPPSKLGDCILTEEESEMGLILGNYSTLSGFLNEHDLDRASPLALSVLMSGREGTFCGQMLSVQTKSKVGHHAFFLSKEKDIVGKNKQICLIFFLTQGTTEK